MICKSVREGSQVKQKTIKYVGMAHNDAEFEALQKAAKAEIYRLEREESQTVTKPSVNEDMCDNAYLCNVREVARLSTGIYDVFGMAFDRLNLHSLFTKIRYEQLKAVVLARIAKPSSKLQASQLLQKQFQKELSVDQIYQLMNIVASKEPEIKSCIFNATTHQLQKQEIALLFFDVTTLYCESQMADELRGFGYSKDHKANEVQVVLALATTSEGLPVGYSLFPGNTAEITTLIKSLEEWRKTFAIKNVTVVGDRGMMSEKNLAEMEKMQIKYIVAAKLKSFSSTLQNKILERNNEVKTSVEKDALLVQEHKLGTRRLVVSYSEKRADKDRKDRERLIKKIRSKLGVKGKAKTEKLITNKGYQKFVTSEKSGEVTLNLKKIEEEAKWDGLHGVITNDPEMSQKELLTLYRRQWIVEDSFRINKHTLSMRPIYHFKPHRIKAHISVCYLAFTLTRYVQLQVKSFWEGSGMSVDKIRDELNTVQSSILEEKNTGKRYKAPSKISKEAECIYKAMGISLQRYPKRLLSKNTM